MFAHVDYTADISRIPARVIDAMPLVALADGLMIADALAVDAAEAPLTDRRSTSVEHLGRTLGWSRDRALRAILACDIVRDVEAGGPSIDMLDTMDHAMAILGRGEGDWAGFNCGMSLPDSLIVEMLRSGRASIVED